MRLLRRWRRLMYSAPFLWSTWWRCSSRTLGYRWFKNIKYIKNKTQKTNIREKWNDYGEAIGVNILDQWNKKTSMKKKARQQEYNMVSILMHKTKCYIITERILHIDSKPHLYFMRKDAIKPDRFIGEPQIAKYKDNSDVKNHHSQIA